MNYNAFPQEHFSRDMSLTIIFVENRYVLFYIIYTKTAQYFNEFRINSSDASYGTQAYTFTSTDSHSHRKS